MKKLFNKEVITYILMMLPFILMAIFTFVFTRNSFDFDMYGFKSLKYQLFWIGFTLSWICLFFLIFYLLPRKKRIPFYIVFYVIWHVVFCAQICYCQKLGKFMVFSDLFLAGEGLQYIKSVILNLNLGMCLIVLVDIALLSSIIYLNKDVLVKDKDVKLKKNSKKEKEVEIVKSKYNRVVISVIVILIFLFRGISYTSLGTVSEANSWQENYNPRNIYNNFTNPNAAMFISGIYEYNTRAVFKYFYNLITFDDTAIKTNVDNYNLIYGIENTDNEYTGLFKDKNVIYIMMESIDSWVVDKDTMPTLYKMMNEGINFNNRYSPFFNGGQTINTEFALNTGLYSISDQSAIYDIEDMDYKYSLANSLKKAGYSVNSFHANTGNFYNRTSFHKLMGYERHYSALDMQRANILDEDVNYYSDYNFINDDYIFDLIIKDDKFFSFITTYSAHLEYSQSNKVYKSIDKKLEENDKWSEEEYIYRTLANDTDKMLKTLISKLRKAGKLDDTVIVLVSDHYVYGYSDEDYVATKKNVENDRKALQNTPFDIRSNDLEHKEVDTILDTADILPTMLNLLGISYNPNMYMGTDVFSINHDHFVWFSDGSYIADKYTTLSHEAMLTKTNYNISKNKSILLTNYYGK